ncbi:hypothetical protein Ssi03_46060 [Sphaerisporangium siamense]|nr:hypothetical protein Ssi03_46060 [Sphaerisporangium siamense]
MSRPQVLSLVPLQDLGLSMRAGEPLGWQLLAAGWAQRGDELAERLDLERVGVVAPRARCAG